MKAVISIRAFRSSQREAGNKNKILKIQFRKDETASI
jgi:hypothetical protein